jgi:ribose 5-phosphate isomerase
VEAIRALGGEPALRIAASDAAYLTDEGHHIVDARFPAGIAAQARVERTIRARPGVVETGLFVGYTPEVIVGDTDGA